jgi:hypothetical protein
MNIVAVAAAATVLLGSHEEPSAEFPSVHRYRQFGVSELRQRPPFGALHL